MEMTPRKEKILSSVVRDFIKSGEPVGSKAIADEIGVSSATVRNEMADLIDLGLLEQPHTSAGRVPSQRGYREYVDRLMVVPPLREEQKRYFDSLLATAYEPENLLARACRLMAGTVRCAAVATTPSGTAAQVRAVQFVQTSRRTAMLLLMSSAGTMKTRVFHCDFDLTVELMRVLFRVFNEHVAGRDVADITPGFLQTLAASLGDMYVLAAPALRALLDAAHETMETQVLLGGQMNLLMYPELDHRRVIDLLERPEEMTELLRGRYGKVTVLIGGESQRAELQNASLFVSRYGVGGQDAGALALLGPTRIDYAKLTAILRYLSEEVGRILTVLLQEE